MELIRSMIRSSRQNCQAYTQVTLDDDFIVPDTMEDMEQILTSRADVILETGKSVSERMQLKGRLDFQLLYQKENGGLASLSGSIPFAEELSVPGLKEKQEPVVSWELEDLRTDMIHSRKAAVRALIRFRIQGEEYIQEELASDIIGTGEEELQKKTGQLKALSLAARRRDNVRIQEQIALPANRPGAEQLIWWEFAPFGMTVRPAEGKLTVTGSLQLFLIYEAEGEAGTLQWLEETIPFAEEVPFPQAEEGLICQTGIHPAHKSLELKADEDGELREFFLDTVFNLDICLYQEETVTLLEDFYSTSEELEPVFQEKEFDRLLTREVCKCRLQEKLDLPEEYLALQPGHSGGSIRMDEPYVQEDGLLLEGALELSQLYLNGGDASVKALKRTIPFECKVAAAGIDESCICQVIPCMEQLSVTAAGGSQAELRALLSFDVLVRQPFEKKAAVDAVVQELDFEKLDNLPGIVGFVSGKEADLWELAKEFHTTEEAIRRDNSLAAGPIAPGQKLVIVKKVG